MFDQVKEEKICKGCHHYFKFHVKRETKFPQKKYRVKSYCISCRGLCQGLMIKNEDIVSR